jgi:hypothetical protein
MGYRFKLRAISNGRKPGWLPGFETIWQAQLLRYKGREVEITIGPRSKANSRAQQKYYRGLVIPMIAKEIGEDEDVTHEILAYKFFSEKTDSGYIRIRSTKLGEWTAFEWEEKMTQIRQWAVEFLNISIPLPNEIMEEL